MYLWIYDLYVSVCGGGGGACMCMFMSLCVGRRIGAEGQAHSLDGSSISQAGERPPFRVRCPTAVATFLEMEGCGVGPHEVHQGIMLTQGTPTTAQ